MTDPLQQLTIDDLPEGLREAAVYLGIDAVRKLVQNLPGVQIRIPTMVSCVSLCDRYIAEHYPHVSVARIARKLKCSPEFVYSRIRVMNLKNGR